MGRLFSLSELLAAATFLAGLALMLGGVLAGMREGRLRTGQIRRVSRTRR